MNEVLTGINSVTEALMGRRKIKHIYILETRRDKRIDTITHLAEKKGVYVQYVNKQQLLQMSGKVNNQGVVAFTESYKYADLNEILQLAQDRGEDPLILILDGLEDPQNLGSIIRTAECAGVHGIVIPRHGATEVSDAVARASAGAVEHFLIAREVNLVNVIKDLKKEGLWIVGADTGAESNFFSVSFPEALALVIGSEGKGIRRLVKENCDYLVKIPMLGKLNSLNASVSAALLIYEVLRQRIVKP
ncbi:MAG: 23S rRNA (guanosine(2251)-2'-O)-methyltransferase RlmB [Syntrophomonadaceae bacterium]|jgi:23S rRNA (guanosine2251-2'-O)-methyltransferase